MATLSLCIATFNEEKNIHYPLDSAIDIVDEVVIVDGGSKDKTLSIAQSYGQKVKVYQTVNHPMFHLNKQKAISLAKSDWILQLDADEALSPELKSEIVQTINDHSLSFVAYFLPRKNWFLGRFLLKGGVYPDYTIRLYRRGNARFPCLSVHENVEIFQPGDNRRDRADLVGYLKNPLLHYADPDFGRYLKRWRRYNLLDAADLLKKDKEPAVIDYLFIKPLTTFISIYFRHLGFLDSWQGLVWAFFSAIRYINIYFLYQKNTKDKVLPKNN